MPRSAATLLAVAALFLCLARTALAEEPGSPDRPTPLADPSSLDRLPDHFIVLMDESASMKKRLGWEGRPFDDPVTLADHQHLATLATTALGAVPEALPSLVYDPDKDFVTYLAFEARGSFAPKDFFRTAPSVSLMHGPLGDIEASIREYYRQRGTGWGCLNGSWSPIAIARLAALPYLGRLDSLRSAEVGPVHHVVLIRITDEGYNGDPADEFAFGRTQKGATRGLPEMQRDVAAVSKMFDMSTQSAECYFSGQAGHEQTCGSRPSDYSYFVTYSEVVPRTAPVDSFAWTDSTALPLDRYVKDEAEVGFVSPPNALNIREDIRSDAFTVRIDRVYRRIWDLSGQDPMRVDGGDGFQWAPLAEYLGTDSGGRARVEQGYLLPKSHAGDASPAKDLDGRSYAVDYRLVALLVPPENGGAAVYPFSFARDARLLPVELQPRELQEGIARYAALPWTQRELTDQLLTVHGVPGERAGQVAAALSRDTATLRGVAEGLTGLGGVVGLIAWLLVPRRLRLELQEKDEVAKTVRVDLNVRHRRTSALGADTSAFLGEPMVVLGSFQIQNSAWEGLAKWGWRFDLEAVAEIVPQLGDLRLAQERELVSIGRVGQMPFRQGSVRASESLYYVFFDPNAVVDVDRPGLPDGPIDLTFKVKVTVRNRRKQDVVGRLIIPLHIEVIPEDPDVEVVLLNLDNEATQSTVDHRVEQDLPVAFVAVASRNVSVCTRPHSIHLNMTGFRLDGDASILGPYFDFDLDNVVVEGSNSKLRPRVEELIPPAEPVRAVIVRDLMARDVARVPIVARTQARTDLAGGAAGFASPVRNPQTGSDTYEIEVTQQCVLTT